jgi:hypothetical protein
MPWACPACGSVIRHSEIQEMPHIGARYRCHICRLELVMDGVTENLIVLPLEDASDRQPKKPKAG